MLLWACSEDTPVIEGFEANIESIEAEAYGGCYDITIRSEQEWVARTDVPWIMVSPANGRGEVKCTIRIDSTLQNDVRNANLYITPDNAEAKAISISQKGFSRSIDPEKSVIDIAAQCGYFSISSFNRNFKQMTSYSPTEYRKKNNHTKKESK